jgi:hypothetical protein
MATVTEHFTSRDGDTVAVDRLEATRTFIVQLVAATEDPILAVQAVIRPDSPHPTRAKFPGLVVQRYVQRLTENPFAWFVDVIYDFPGRAGFAGWQLQVTYGEETVRKYVDLDDKRVGSRAYLPVAPDSTDVSPYYANTLGGHTRLRLADPEGDTRRREGMDVLVGATGLVLSRTLYGITERTLREIDTYSHRTNTSHFIAWEPNELLFRNATVREESGPPGEGNLRLRQAIVYPVELNFSVRRSSIDEPEGWRLLRHVDTFRDQLGNESVVKRSVPDAEDEIVDDVYRRYHAVEFYDLIQLLEGGSPFGGLAGRRS